MEKKLSEKELFKKIDQLNKHKIKYDQMLGEIYEYLQDKMPFEIYLNWFPDDGLCVMSDLENTGMGINEVLKILKDKGKVTKKDWNPSF